MRAILLITAAAVSTLAACSQRSPETSAPEATASSLPKAPAGAYTLDPAHSSLTFRVSHIGFSNYTGEFKRFDARLQFDPENLASSSVTVTIDPASLDVVNPPEGFMQTLMDEAWLSAVRFPEMTFRSTRVEPTGSASMRIHGELDFRGATQPVILDATFNGGYAGHPLEPQARTGFSARGTLQRSKFGMTIGVPPPGTTFGVGDDVEFIIETEFTGPPTDRTAEQPKN